MNTMYVDSNGRARCGEQIGHKPRDFHEAEIRERDAMAQAERQYATSNKVSVPAVSLANVFEALRETHEMVDRAVSRSGGSADVLVGHEPEPSCGATESSRAPSGAVEALHTQVLRVLDSVNRLHGHLGRIERGVGL